MNPLFKRLLQDHVWPYRLMLLRAVGCMIIAAAATASMAYLLQPVFDDVFVRKSTEAMQLLAGVVMLTFVAKGVSSYGEAVLMTRVGSRVLADIQARVFAHLMQADLSYFHAQGSGQLLSRMTNDITLMRGIVASVIVGLGKDFLTLVFLVAVMAYQDPALALGAFVFLPIAVFPLRTLARRLRKATHKGQDTMAQLTSALSEVFQGIRVVKAYTMEAFEQTRVKALIESIFHTTNKIARAKSATHPVMETLAGAAIVLIILYGGTQVIEGHRTTGAFVSFISAMLLAYEPLKRLAHLNANLQEGLAATARIYDVLDAPIEIANHPGALTAQVKTGALQFAHVDMVYPNGYKALHDIGFDIKPGEKVAFVGHSGAGKSSLINLLLRFYDPKSGHITIDGQDIRDLTLASLRSQIGLVSQDITLFDMSVRDNIRYGSMATPDKAVIAAAKAAGAHDFIQGLTQGYDTPIGEAGVLLSGGQRQRIAIARALLKDAPILLLDEATSHLDSKTEEMIQDSLARLMEGRTTLVIAHRLNTIRNVDRIFVMDGGRIIDSGTHAVLLKRCALYKALWQALES